MDIEAFPESVEQQHALYQLWPVLDSATAPADSSWKTTPNRFGTIAEPTGLIVPKPGTLAARRHCSPQPVKGAGVDLVPENGEILTPIFYKAVEARDPWLTPISHAMVGVRHSDDGAGQPTFFNLK